MSRLEEIKEEVMEFDVTSENFDKDIPKNIAEKQLFVTYMSDMKWLISRIEQLEDKLRDSEFSLEISDSSQIELEAENKRCKQTLERLTKTQDEIWDENIRFREALEFYADKDNWEVHQLTDGVLDGGNIVPPEYEPAWAYADEGEVARRALKGDTDDRGREI